MDCTEIIDNCVEIIKLQADVIQSYHSILMQHIQYEELSTLQCFSDMCKARELTEKTLSLIT